MADVKVDIKQSFAGGLDLDTSYNSVQKDCYVDALNITRDAVSGNNDDDITNVVGNQLREYTLPAGTNVVIGAFAFRLRSTVIRFVYNSNGNHTVLQYSDLTKVTTKIFENLTDSGDVDILGFTLIGKITSVNVFPRTEEEGDLLFFLDSIGRPTTMNITRFINGEYTPVTRDIIDVGKRPPLSPPDCVYANDATHAVNNTRNKFFRFKYRWIYDDFEKSTCSPISAMPMPSNLLDDEFTNVSTNNNQITVVFNSGPQNVAKIELLVSYVNKTNNWSDFALVESIDKEEFGIDNEISWAYNFYNDATYPIIDPDESILLFDYVPELANAQEMPNGNVLTYAAITEGIDRDLDANVTITVGTVEAGGGTPTGSLTGMVVRFESQVGGAVLEYFISFSGIPAEGTIVNVYLNTNPGGVPTLVGTYTTVSGDTELQVRLGLQTSMNAINIVQDVDLNGDGTLDFEFFSAQYTFGEIEIVPPSSDADDNSIATWPWSTQRNLGLIYFNQKGKTPGVVYNTGITFPEYSETTPNVVDLPYINAKIFHVPPIWAYSYQWVITKEPTTGLFWEVIDVNKEEAEYIYFDITNMALNQAKNPTTAAVLNWSFVDGDRMRLIKRDSDDFVFPTSSFDIGVEGIVVDPKINSVDKIGTFVKIKNIPPYTAEDYTSDFFIIQLYRPGQQSATDENQVYYEFGIEYPILNPGTAERVHAGEVTDQSADYVTPAEVNMYNGDSYFRVRTVYLSETGFGTFFVQDRNVVDIFTSTVSSVDGRPLLIDVNQKSAYFSATGRFGQAYQANTNINGLNRFYENNFYDCDISYGDIMRLAVSDRRIWVFQKFKIGQLPIFSQINKQPDGTTVNVVTDQLINPIDYYDGNWGIGDASTSLVLFNYAAYFCDNINGVILRLSKDGLTPISFLYKVNSWANRELPLRTDGVFIYGGYDQRLNNYIISLEQAVYARSMVISFSAKFGAGDTRPYLFALANTPNAGDVVTLVLTDGDAVERTYEYTAVEGDTATTIINELDMLISADIYFTAVVTAVFPESGLSINQVTANNPTLFTGVSSLTYDESSYSPAQTLTFTESKSQNERPSFEGFISLQPEWMCSLGTLLISFKNGALWTHDSATYNNFFGTQYGSSITPLFNDQSAIKKTYNGIGYQSNQIWASPTNGDIESSMVNEQTGLPSISNIKEPDYELEENVYVAAFNRDANSMADSRMAVMEGDFLKGVWVKCKLTCPAANASELVFLKLPYITWSLSNRNF